MGLESVELVISWEEAFGISIPNSIAATLATPAHAAVAIEKLLLDAGRHVGRIEIDRVIKEITLETSGMNEDDYRLDGLFVRDFGID